MTILYIAYSCSPNHGSEDRIGWKVPLACAQKHRVKVITKAEHQAVIRQYQKDHPECSVEFHYVDIPSVYKKIFRGFAYSGRLTIWQKRAVALAETLCAGGDVDLIHQITPVEYRSIGDYGRIPGVRFVCGPIGGGETIPSGLQKYARRHALQEWLRKWANRRSIRALKASGILSRCDGLLYVNQETRQSLSGIPQPGAEQACFPEIGMEAGEIQKEILPKKSSETIFLVAGRLAYRKGHAFLLEVLSRLPRDASYQCYFVGDGPCRKRLMKQCTRLGLQEKVIFEGRVPFDQMKEIYAKAHALILPSLRETTGSVVLEAMANGLPVIAAEAFGAAEILDESCAWLYRADGEGRYEEPLKHCLLACMASPEEVAKKAAGALEQCRKHTWETKIERYWDWYESVR